MPVEQVLCVPTARFREIGYFEGFRADTAALAGLLDPAVTRYLPRPEAERDPTHKQLIPYCLLVAPGGGGRTHLRLPPRVRRGGGAVGGEGLVRRRRAHLDARPRRRWRTPIWRGMRRELEEEVSIPGGFTERLVGLINDDATEVGRVHLGVVHRLHLNPPASDDPENPQGLPQVLPREASMTEAGFRDPRALLADPAGLESWTRIALEALFAPAAEVLSGEISVRVSPPAARLLQLVPRQDRRGFSPARDEGTSPMSAPDLPAPCSRRAFGAALAGAAALGRRRSRVGPGAARRRGTRGPAAAARRADGGIPGGAAVRDRPEADPGEKPLRFPVQGPRWKGSSGTSRCPRSSPATGRACG